MSANPLRGIAGIAFVLGVGLFVYEFAFSGDDSSPLSAAAEATVTSADTITLAPTPTNSPPDTTTSETRPTETKVPTATPRPFDGTVASMRIPRFDVDAAVENIGIDQTNRLEVPENPLNAGWYGIYQKPGWVLTPCLRHMWTIVRTSEDPSTTLRT